MSKSLITDEEFVRFEHFIWRVWHVYKFGQDKYNAMTDEEIENVNRIFEQLKQSHPREYDIIIRHYLKNIYYTVIAREQNVSEGYIRKLAKNGAYYFLQLYDKK